MAEAVKSITAGTYSASTGKGIRYVGNHMYGYSGTVAVGDSTVELLSFTSGSGYIVGRVQFFYPTANTEDFLYTIVLNGAAVAASVAENFIRRSDNYINIIIPPFTDVSLTAINISDSTSRNQTVMLTGRVYGAE